MNNNIVYILPAKKKFVYILQKKNRILDPKKGLQLDLHGDLHFLGYSLKFAIGLEKYGLPYHTNKTEKRWRQT